MVNAFEQSSGHLVQRLITTLETGIAAGGEEGPVRSAGVQVVHKVPWPVVDLRVDWDENPLPKLRTIWNEYQPQLEPYVTRALNPEAAPSYGVPGDLWAMIISRNIGIKGFFGDANDEKARKYYEQFGFIPMPDNKQQIFLAMNGLQQAYQTIS